MRESELTQFYLQQILSLLTTPLGMAGLFALLAVIAATVTVPWMRWACLTGLIYIATIPLTEGGANVRYVPLAPPLEQFRSFGRPLIYLFLGLLLIPMVLSERGWRRRIIAGPILMFFAFEILISLRLMVYGNYVRGMLGIVSHTIILLTLAYGVSRWLQTMDDAYKFIWCLALAGGLVALGTTYQMAVNRAPVMSGNRLTGVTGNPQFLGIIISYTLPCACHLLSRPITRKWMKLLLITQVAVMVVMLGWTGSRTGALATAVGLLVLFHRRLGKFAILGSVVGVAVLIALPFFEGVNDVAGRLLWTGNTRAGVWNMMWETFKDAPLMGNAEQVFTTSESSYLAMLSQFGIIGSFPCFVAIGLLVWQLLSLLRLRKRLGGESGLVDLTLGVWSAIFVTSVLEGLLMGVITYPAMFIFAMSAFTTFLQDWGQTEEAYAVDQPYPVYAASAA